MKLRRVAFVLLFARLLSPDGMDCQPGAVPMPQEPGALMGLAHDKNGFSSADVRPWHMRGTYHSYKDGKVEYEGQYEEWWFSPKQYKLTFSNPGFAQTDYASGTTLLRDGAQDWLSGPELLLRAGLVDPLPEAALLANFKLKRGSRTVGQAKLDCVTLTYKTRTGHDLNSFPSACFESTMPVLRIFDQGYGLATWYDHIVLVQGHYIAHQIQVRNRGNLTADLNVESIEMLRSSPEAVITPPSSAIAVDLSQITMKREGSHFWPLPLMVATPDFAPNEPADPHANRPIAVNSDLTPEARAELIPLKIVQGVVTVKVKVGPNGHLDSADIVSGVVRLQQPALAAARQWLFRPFIVMGEARAVETEISLTVNSVVF